MTNIIVDLPHGKHIKLKDATLKEKSKGWLELTSPTLTDTIAYKWISAGGDSRLVTKDWIYLNARPGGSSDGLVDVLYSSKVDAKDYI
jgi:hypothetical protein